MTRQSRAQSSRTLPPRQRSSLGPFAFLLVVIALFVGAFFVGRPMAEDALVAYVAEHPTLLRQEIVRAVVADRVRDDVDRAKDESAETRPFVIARGETAGQIGRRLEADGIIRSALAFDFVLYETDKENALQSGTYNVSSALTPRELARLFEKAPDDQTVLRIIEGWRLTEVATAVNKAFPSISKEAFTAAAVVGDRKNFVLAGLAPTVPLEGYLFPDTYFMRPNMTASQIVDVLLDTFEKKVGTALRTASTARNMSIYDIVKLASIVEREARDRKESATIAGVYTNRLGIGMKLDADPTIQYALGEWRELSLDDLKLDSPYNTYLYGGLPPTPIANPGAAALEGAAKPEDVPWLYFVAKSDGTGGHAFARTLEEHEANRVKYGNK
ncbi:MAG TPA: endolytic transglycosylase MltG [Candidatus Limnocylindria bacterium]|nr:endolytic transglycosylase MltG [Candidatus Limnocylindria bacterium]